MQASELALPLIVAKDVSGELRITAAPAVARDGLRPYGVRPPFIKEVAIEELLWGSEAALGWLARYGEGSAYRQVTFTGDVRTDLVLETDRLAIVELEKDGRHKAASQLLQQREALLKGRKPPPEVDLVAVDWRATKPDGGLRSVVWRIAEGDGRHWLTLSEREPSSTTGLRAAEWPAHVGDEYEELRDGSCPYHASIWQEVVLGADGPCPVTSLVLKIPSVRYRQTQIVGRNAFRWRKEMNEDAVLAALAARHWGQFANAGASCWEIRRWHAIAWKELRFHFPTGGREKALAAFKSIDEWARPELDGGSEGIGA